MSSPFHTSSTTLTSWVVRQKPILHHPPRFCHIVLKWGPHRCLQDKTPCPLVLNNQLCTILASQVPFILTTDNGNLSTAGDCVLEIIVFHVGQKASPPTEKGVGGAV
ncbi:unnamed protein product [Ectocarpus sp. CCAP 1310/34]|nr:unnamed protein product [Ectocarpus sp. CCAP 1310/34]